MIHRDPRCVHVVDNPMEAEVVAAWLNDHGVLAEVMNRNTLGGLEGLTPWSSTGVSARGIEIWVRNAADAEKARTLIEQEEEQRSARQAARASASGSLLVTCEDCGLTSSFPASKQGSVQNCPHCGSYIDVEPPEADSFEAAADADWDDDNTDDPDTRIEKP